MLFNLTNSFILDKSVKKFKGWDIAEVPNVEQNNLLVKFNLIYSVE